MNTTPAIDPIQIFLQAGGFGMAFFLVIWITRTQSACLSKLFDAVERNTEALNVLKALIEANYERRH